jgi:uncharacterized protein YecT (DUF1311 family)
VQANQQIYINQKIEKTYAACEGKDSSTYGLNQCYKAEMEQYDAVLSGMYQKKISSLEKQISESGPADSGTANIDMFYKEEKARLLSAKEAGGVYRHALCSALSAENTTGTMSGITYGSCTVEAIKQQITFLMSQTDAVGNSLFPRPQN